MSSALAVVVLHRIETHDMLSSGLLMSARLTEQSNGLVSLNIAALSGRPEPGRASLPAGIWPGPITRIDHIAKIRLKGGPQSSPGQVGPPKRASLSVAHYESGLHTVPVGSSD